MAITVVAAIIEDDAGLMLCAKRGDWKDSPNKWEFPGGKPKPGENLEAALKREMKDFSMFRRRSSTFDSPSRYPLSPVACFGTDVAELWEILEMYDQETGNKQTLHAISENKSYDSEEDYDEDQMVAAVNARKQGTARNARTKQSLGNQDN